MSSITDNKITMDEVTRVFVQRQANRLSGTPQQNKQVFDTYPDLIRSKFNKALDDIGESFDGDDERFEQAESRIQTLEEINAEEAARNARASAQEASESASQARSHASSAYTYKQNAQSSASSASSSANQAAQSAAHVDDVASDIQNVTATATTLPASSQATAEFNTDTDVLSFGIPQGEKGEQGDVSKEQWLASFIGNTANGSVASFNDGADNVPMQSLVATIEEVQAGSGDPSPTNVRAITGWAAANVKVVGKNLIGFKSLLDNWESAYTDLGDGSYNVTNTGNGYREPFRFASKDIDVTLSGEITQLSGSVGWRLQLLNSNGEAVASLGSGSTTLSGKGCKLRLNYSTGGEGANYKNIQLELGTTATAFESYTGKTYPVSFGSAGTVYGGTVDVVTGVLTVTHKAETFNGTESWGSEQTSGGLTNYYLNLDNASKMTGRQGGLLDDELLCNWLAPSSLITTYAVYVGTTSKFLNCKCSSASDVTSFKAMMTETPLVVIYPLETPETYQLTQTEIKTLLGKNNVWADTGSVVVDYKADTKLYIDNKILELQP